jgi:hypothetical protein
MCGAVLLYIRLQNITPDENNANYVSSQVLPPQVEDYIGSNIDEYFLKIQKLPFQIDRKT